MKKQLLMTLALASVVIGSGMVAANFAPRFAGDDSIEFVAPGLRCGLIGLKPKTGVGTVWIQSVVYYGSTGQEKVISRETTDYLMSGNPTLIQLQPSGMESRYDWAGGDTNTKYKIYCYKQASKNEYPAKVRCQDVVDITRFLHNRTCGLDVGVAEWAGGSGTPDRKLNLNIPWHGKND